MRPALFLPTKIIKACKSVKRKLRNKDFRALSFSSLYPDCVAVELEELESSTGDGAFSVTGAGSLFGVAEARKKM